MTDAWNDLFVRTDVRETSPDVRYGGLASPDIIPVGTKLPDPSTFKTADSYKLYYQESFYQDQPNYIFVRAKNSSTNEPATGTVRLVMCNPAVVLWPGGDNWTVLNTATGSDHCDLTDVAGGAIGVTGDGGPETAPFVIVPKESGHRCLVTWLSTLKHKVPNKPPRIDNIDALVKWLIDNPNYAHHNIDIVADTTGIQTRVNPFTAGNAPAKWVFALTVKKCKGFTVAFSCAKRLESGLYIQLENQTVGTDDPFAYTIDRDVEAGFTADIYCTYNQNNLPLPDGFEFSFKASASYAPGHPLHKYGQRYHTWEPGVGMVLSPNTKIDVGSIGVVKRSVQP
jgi:hypothetical protein